MTPYPWNVEIVVAGVTWYGPGMESKGVAESVADVARDCDGVVRAEVVRDE